MQSKLRIAFFPYGLAQENPYQNLLIEGLEKAGAEVIKVPGRKLFPLLSLLKVKFDIVHIFWPHDLYMGKNAITRIIKQWSLRATLFILSRQAAVYSAENVTSHHAGLMSTQKEISWISKILKHCKGIVFMSEASKEVFSQFYGIENLKTAITPHVSYRSVYPNTIGIEDAKNRLNLKGDFVYLILGRLQPYKGIEQSIEAFKLVKKPNVKLLIAGKSISANYLEQLKALAAPLFNKSIIIHDAYIPNQDIQYYMNASNCIIINYTDIPLNPGSIVMTKDFGLPVIANNHPVILEVCGNLPNYTFTGGNITSLFNAMEQAYEKNLPINNSLAKQVENSPENIGKLLMAFYQTV